MSQTALMVDVALDHLQIAIPEGGEARARAFFGDLLGLREVPKPAALHGRGGVWFSLTDGIGLHLGVDADFRPASKAHAGLRFVAFADLLKRLETAGIAMEHGSDTFGRRRVYLTDPFGNRLELIDGA